MISSVSRYGSAFCGLLNVTTKFSSNSASESPATSNVINADVSFGPKVTVPVGNAPPAKSSAVAALGPVPETV